MRTLPRLATILAVGGFLLGIAPAAQACHVCHQKKLARSMACRPAQGGMAPAPGYNPYAYGGGMNYGYYPNYGGYTIPPAQSSTRPVIHVITHVGDPEPGRAYTDEKLEKRLIDLEEKVKKIDVLEANDQRILKILVDAQAKGKL